MPSMLHILIRLCIRVKVFIFAFALMSTSVLFGNAEEEIITTIILINSQAELVDMDREGEILRRHLAIPDYFSSGRSHNNSLRRSLDQIKDYGIIEDFSIPGGSNLPAVCLQSFMKKATDPETSDSFSFESPANQLLEFPEIKTVANFEVYSVIQSINIKDHHKLPLSNSSMRDVFYPSISNLQIPKPHKQRYKKDKRFSFGDFSDRLS